MPPFRGHALASVALVLLLSSGVLAASMEKSEYLYVVDSKGNDATINLKSLASHVYSMEAEPRPRYDTLHYGIGVEKVACGGNLTGATIYCKQGMKDVYKPQLNSTSEIGEVVHEVSFFNQAACKSPVHVSPGRCSKLISKDPNNRQFNLDELEALTSHAQTPLIAHHPVTGHSYIFSICSNTSTASTGDGALIRIDGSSGKLTDAIGVWPLNLTDVVYDPRERAVHLNLDEGKHNSRARVVVHCNPDAAVPSHIHITGENTYSPVAHLTHRSGCPL